MSKKYLYLEGASGISGDMTVASLLDLGASQEKLNHVLQSLQLEGFRQVISRGQSYGMDGCVFDVLLESDEVHTPHESGHAAAHSTDHEDHHHHHHDHHEEPHRHHEHRNLADVYAVIDRGEMSDRANALAKRIFLIVAEAEAKAHGRPIAEVHFHEVGAIDSIVDIVATAVCLDDLGVTDCIVTGLSEGTGFVHCQHGDLPVPVPAVALIAERYQIPLRMTSAKGEMVTPTGIAIAAALRTHSELPAQFTIEKLGIGLGKRDFGRANMLRSMILSETVDSARVWMVESNIDDSTGEQLGLALEALTKAGALDVHYVPCLMKKTRPAYLLRILVTEDKLAVIEDVVFRHTTTIGLRKYPVERTCLQREIVRVSLACGTVEVKKCSWNGAVFYYPEYESVKQVSTESGVDFKTVFDPAKAEAAK